MNTLLVCTDFSAPSAHAAQYACMLAQQHRFSRIVLFHAYQVFAPALTLPMTVYADDELYKSSIRQLHDTQKELQQLAGSEISVDVRAEDVSLGESINRICKDENADMIVMGMKGKSNVEKALSGSNTVDVAKNTDYPVWIIPQEAPIMPIRRALIACDLGKVTETIPVHLMNAVLDRLNVPLTILNVDHENKHFKPNTPDEMYHLHHIFDRYHPEYAFTDNKDVVTGILEYAKQNDISLIIAMPGNYNFFQQMFHRRTAEKLIYRSSIPLLTLHAQ